MTLKEIVDNIRNVAGRFIPTDDMRLHPEQVRHWIEVYRATFMMEGTDFGKDINPQLFQDMGILELSEVDKSECGDVPTGCKIKKYCGIPELVSFPKKRGYRAFLADKQTPIEIIDHRDAKFSTLSRFDCALSWAYLVGNCLYIESQKDIQYINFRGVFTSPTEVETFCASNNTKECTDDWDFEFPVDDKLLSSIYRSIYESEFGISYSMIKDDKNNSADTA